MIRNPIYKKSGHFQTCRSQMVLNRCCTFSTVHFTVIQHFKSDRNVLMPVSKLPTHWSECLVMLTLSTQSDIHQYGQQQLCGLIVAFSVAVVVAQSWFWSICKWSVWAGINRSLGRHCFTSFVLEKSHYFILERKSHFDNDSPWWAHPQIADLASSQVK